jgi:hypothetical protein
MGPPLFQPITGQNLEVPSQNGTPFFRSMMSRPPAHLKKDSCIQSPMSEVLHTQLRQETTGHPAKRWHKLKILLQ